jgi:hypothetical protein
LELASDNSTSTLASTHGMISFIPSQFGGHRGAGRPNVVLCTIIARRTGQAVHGYHQAPRNHTVVTQGAINNRPKCMNSYYHKATTADPIALLHYKGHAFCFKNQPQSNLRHQTDSSRNSFAFLLSRLCFIGEQPM